ncbi:MAG: MFS transporter [Chlamydiales bacterium]|nr:MFS transporter [Chlamydiales bacterium]
MAETSNLKQHHYITKKRYSAMLIFCIFCAQFAYSTIIYNLKHITNFDLFWVAFYHTAALFFAIPQAGLSDNQGRKKHLLIALLCILLAVLLFLVSYFLAKMSLISTSEFSFSLLTALPICLFLGVAGNVIPIARAGLTDLKIHDFRIAMGWSTTFIGFGWVAPILLGLIFFPAGVITSLILFLLISLISIKKHFFDQEDLNIKKAPQFKKIIKNSYLWFISMFLVTGGASALFAYVFSEISFYQVYLLTAEGIIENETQVVGLIMAFGYAFGIIMQWIIYNSDESGVKFGSLFSFLSLFILFLLKISINYHYLTLPTKTYFIIEGLFNFLFSFGFGFLIPSLFSLMARKIRPHHAGRLFGAIDIMDTLALNGSALILFFKEKLKFNDSIDYTIALCLFLTSIFCYKNFLRRFSSYEKSL